MRQLLVRGAVLSLLFLLVAGGAIAGTQRVTKKIDATYRGIKVYVNGSLVISPIEPFIIGEGTMMVPLRVISEAIGKRVLWDEATSSVYISDPVVVLPVSPVPVTGGATIVAPQSEYTLIENMTLLRNVADAFYRQQNKPYRIASRKFESGIAAEVKKNDVLEMVLDLDGRYQWTRGFTGVDDETRNSFGAYRLTIIADDDRQLYKNTIGPSQYPHYVELDTRNIKRLTFRVEWVNGGLGDFERVIASMVDFRFYPERPSQ